MCFLEVKSLQLLQFCSRYLVSTVFPRFLFLQQPIFYWVGYGGQEHTHTELISSWRNQYCATPSGYKQATCTVLSLPSIPDEFLPIPKDNLHSKNYCSLGQNAITFLWAVMYVRNTAGAGCLSFSPADFPAFCRTDSFYPFPPVYIKILIAVLNKDFSLQSE